MKIIAIIVTYNRCQLLRRCIQHVLSQTRKPDHLLVINHSSTDGTLEMLEQNNIHVITQENLGSAAGWYRGIEYALSQNYDAVWLMDDDGFPDANALVLLAQELTPHRSCVSSVVMQEDDNDRFVFPFPVLNAKRLPVVFARQRKIKTLSELKKKVAFNIYPFAHLFNGALVSMDAIRKIGNVNRDFFIFGDEVDFFFRLRTFGEVVSLLSAKHYHPNVAARPYSLMKMYFYLKNSMILNKRYFDHVWLRHLLAVIAILTRTYLRNGIGDVKKFVASPLFYRAFFRGLQGRIGHDFENT